MAHAIIIITSILVWDNSNFVLFIKYHLWNSPQILPPAIKLSMLFLNMSTDADDFTESGKVFQVSTTLTDQKFFLTSDFPSFLSTLKLPDVSLVDMAPSRFWAGENQVEGSTRSFPAMTLNIWIRSPLLRLFSRVVIPISASLSP